MCPRYFLWCCLVFEVRELQQENEGSLGKLQETAEQFEWLCQQQRYWMCCVKRSVLPPWPFDLMELSFTITHLITDYSTWAISVFVFCQCSSHFSWTGLCWKNVVILHILSVKEKINICFLLTKLLQPQPQDGENNCDLNPAGKTGIHWFWCWSMLVFPAGQLDDGWTDLLVVKVVAVS